jgi:hypothetical protein
MASIKTRNLVQIVLILALVAAAIRLAIIYSGRAGRPAQPEQAAAPPLNPEAYVVPKKLYISSLKSAQQLVGQDVWIKEGYRYSFYPYERTVDFAHAAGLLLPLEKMKIEKVTTAAAAGDRERQIVAVFSESGKHYAVPIGVESGGDASIYADEMFFYEDPQSLYSFWSPQIWDAIHKHQVLKGMNEIQAAFAVGMGVPEPGASQELKTVNYPNGGKPLVVTYNNGRAVDIKQAAS